MKFLTIKRKPFSFCVVTVLFSFMCVSLTACMVIRQPVRAETDKDEVFTGELKSTPTDGSFEIKNKNGVTCHGNYDRYLTQSPTIPLKVYVSCSDARHGFVLAKIDLPFKAKNNSGTGTGTLNDGTQLNFVWGKKRVDEMAQ